MALVSQGMREEGRRWREGGREKMEGGRREEGEREEGGDGEREEEERERGGERKGRERKRAGREAGETYVHNKLIFNSLCT